MKHVNSFWVKSFKRVEIFSFTLIIVFIGLGGASAQTELKFADSLPKSYAYFPAMHAFKAAAEGKSKSLTISLFPEAVLGDQKALLEATKIGSIDIAIVANQVSQQLAPEHGVFGLPFVWGTLGDYMKFIQSPTAIDIGRRLEPHGIKVLTFANGGSMAIVNSKRAVKGPEDMKGLKLRVMQDPMQIDMIKSMGGIPVPMGIPEVYSAIQQGQLDGHASVTQVLWASKSHEVAKHLSVTAHGRSVGVVIMNLRKWNSLNPEQKLAVEVGTKAFFDNHQGFFVSNPNTSDENIVGFMTKSGVTVTEPDIAAFRKATAPIVQAFRTRLNSPLVERALAEAGVK